MRGRRLHQGEGQDLHHVVLHDVAQRPGALVEAAPVFDAERFGHGDLHVVDVAPVPDGFEDRVGETQGKDVLDGLLAHVVVDAVDLRLVEAFVQGLVESHGGLEVAAEGLFDHESGELAPGPRTVQAVAGQATGHLPEKRRDGGQVVDPVARRAPAPFCLVELGEDLGDLLERGVVVVVPAHVAELLDEVSPGGLGVGDRLEAALAELVIGPLGPGDTDEDEAVRERAVARQRRQGREELARGEVARGAEHHQRQRRPFCLRPLRGHDGAFSDARRTAWPPNWLRNAASSRIP